MKYFFISLIIAFYIGLTGLSAQARVHIDITRGNVDPLPVALPSPASDDLQAQKIGDDIIGVITKDLERSGLFRIISKRAYIQELKASADIPNFPDWRQINASVLFSGFGAGSGSGVESSGFTDGSGNAIFG
jgi:TolB protein